MKIILSKKQIIIISVVFLLSLVLTLFLSSSSIKQKQEVRKEAEEVRKEIIVSLDPQTNNQANPWPTGHEQTINIKIKNTTSDKTLKFRVVGLELNFNPQDIEIQTSSLTCNPPFVLAGGNASRVEDLLLSLVCYIPPNENSPSEPLSLAPEAEINVGSFEVKVKENPPGDRTHITFNRTNIPEEDSLEDLSKFGQTATYYIAGAQATATPTPTPTSSPGQVKIRFKVKFSGVNSKKADQIVKVKIGKENNLLQEIEEVNLTANNEGIYESPLITLSPEVNSDSGYYLLIKGPKHLQVRFCQNSGQIRPCTTGKIILNSGENILDFTDYPLPGGDLPPQDGVVNAIDAVALVNCLNTPETQECLNKADLNFDGIVNTMDINIMNNTIYTRWEDE